MKPAFSPLKSWMEASSRRGESSNSKTGFQFGTQDLHSEAVSELSTHFLCWVQVTLVILMGS